METGRSRMFRKYDIPSNDHRWRNNFTRDAPELKLVPLSRRVWVSDAANCPEVRNQTAGQDVGRNGTCSSERPLSILSGPTSGLVVGTRGAAVALWSQPRPLSSRSNRRDGGGGKRTQGTAEIGL